MAERSRPLKQEFQPLPSPGRFDATIHPGLGRKSLHELDGETLDRMPDRYGRLRVLITAEGIVDLVDRGYEVRIRRHHPIQGSPRELIATDASVERWLEETFGDLPQEPPTNASRRTKPR